MELRSESQGPVGALQAQFQFVGAAGSHGADPVIQQVAELAELPEPLQVEDHGGGVKGRPVVEAHPLPQGNPGGQAVVTELG